MATGDVGIRIRLDGAAEAARGAREVADGIGAISPSAQEATRGAQALNISLADMAKGVVGVQLLASAFGTMATAIAALPKAGFDYSRQIETAAVGMAGILGSMAAINGQNVQFAQGLGIAQGIMRSLSDDALRTAASSQELIATFQALLAPGLAAKMSIEQIRELTVVGTNAVKSMGLEGQQVVQELRDLVAGGITPAASQLATALGLRDEDIARAKGSAEGLFAFLMDKLQGFKSSSEYFGNTLQGRMDALKEGAQRVAAEGMAPLTAAISATAGEAAKLFVTIDQAGNAQLNPQLVQSIRDVASGFVDVMGVGKDAVAVLWQNRDAVGALVGAYAALKLGGIAADLARTVAAKVELANASRLAAAQAAAEAQANGAVTLSAREKLAAYIAELQANVERTAAQVAQTAATGNAAAAERAHAAAVAQLARAQDAASFSSRAFGAVVGALGGPIGIAITALAGLVGWMISARNEAAQLAKVQQSQSRIEAGGAIDPRDVTRLQAQLDQLKETRDELLIDQKDGGLIGWLFGNDYQVGVSAKLKDTEAQIKSLEATLAKATQTTNAAAAAQGQVTVTLAGAEQAWRNTTVGIKTAGSVTAEYQQKLSASRQAFAAYVEQLEAAGAPADKIAQATKEQAAVEAALAKARDDGLKNLQEHAAATKAQGNAFADVQAAAKAWEAALQDATSRLDKAQAKTDGLSETQAKLRSYLVSSAYSINEKTNPAMNQLAVQTYTAAIRAEQAQAAFAEVQKAHDDLVASYARGAQTVADTIARLTDEMAAADLAKAAKISLAQATEQVTIARLQEQQTIQMSYGDDAAVTAIQAEIDKRRELLGVLASKDARDANAKATKDAEDAWQKATDQVSQSLSDALMNGGKSGAEYVQGLFRSMVLRPVVQAIVNPVAQAVTGTANAAIQDATGVNLLGVAGAASLAGIGTTAAVGFGNVASSMGFFGGDALEGMLAANGAFGTAATGSALGAIGAALPWVGGALAIGSLLGGLFGGGSPRTYLTTSSRADGGPKGFEDGVKVQSAYGYIGLEDKWTKNIDANSMKPAFDAIAQLDNAIAAALSPQQNAKIAAALDGYVSEKNDSVETYVKGRLAIVTQTIGGALNELAGMFSGTTDQLASYVIELANAQKLLPALADLGAFGAVSAAMLQNSQSALQLADALQTTFGSTDNASAALQSYYANFYTEQERTAAATQKVSDAFAQLGLTMPSTRDAFRDLVQAQDVNTDAGRRMYASLIALSGAFAAVVPAAQQATQAVDQQVQSLQAKSQELQNQLALLQGTKTQEQIDTAGMSDVAISIYRYNASLQSQIDAINTASAAAQADAQKRYDLETQLLQLQGNTSALRARELDGLSATNQALQQQVWALQDAQAAQQAYNQQLQAAQQAYQSAQANLASAQNAVKAVQDKATNAYLSAQDKVVNAQQALANAQQQAAKSAYDAAMAMRQLGTNLQDWVRQQSAVATDPQTAARMAAAQYRTTLTAARSGDQTALQKLTQDAGAYLSAAQTVNASQDYALLRASVLGEVQRLGAGISAQPLPPEPSAQDPVAIAQQNLADATAEMTRAMSAALSIGAPLTQAAQDIAAEYRTAIAAQQSAQAQLDATAAQLSAIVKNTGGTLTADQRAILQQATATATKTVQMLVNDSSLTADQKKYLNLASLTNATISMSGSVTFDPSNSMLSIWKAIMFGTALQVHVLESIANATTMTYEAVSGQKIAYRYTNVFSNNQFDAYSASLRNTVLANANGNAFINGQVQAFASGASFANTIVNRPTYFDMGLMGEAGPEAIMPLTRTSDGKLGVRATGPSTVVVPVPMQGTDSGAQQMRDLLARIAQQARSQTEEVIALRKRVDQQLIEQSRMSQDIARMRSNGMLVYSDPAEPLHTTSATTP